MIENVKANDVLKFLYLGTDGLVRKRDRLNQRITQKEEQVKNQQYEERHSNTARELFDFHLSLEMLESQITTYRLMGDIIKNNKNDEYKLSLADINTLVTGSIGAAASYYRDVQ